MMKVMMMIIVKGDSKLARTRVIELDIFSLYLQSIWSIHIMQYISLYFGILPSWKCSDFTFCVMSV